MTDPSTIAFGFNEYFVNVGRSLAERVPEQGDSFRTYLRNRQINEFHFPVVNRQLLLNVVEHMKDAAAGNDDIPMCIIKEVVADLADVLVYLVNLSFSKGIFPDMLEIAKVPPTYKSGDKDLFTNYRPISILPALSKIIEKKNMR